MFKVYILFKFFLTQNAYGIPFHFNTCTFKVFSLAFDAVVFMWNSSVLDCVYENVY